MSPGNPSPRAEKGVPKPPPLPPAIRAEGQRILDRAARRLLAQRRRQQR